MKSLLIAFFITLAALCVALWCIQTWKLARADRIDCEEEVANYAKQPNWYREYVRGNLSKDPRLPAQEGERIVASLTQSEEGYIQAIAGLAREAREREDDARQVALSSGGLTIIGILALAFRGRQLWNSNPPNVDMPYGHTLKGDGL